MSKERTDYRKPYFQSIKSIGKDYNNNRRTEMFNIKTYLIFIVHYPDAILVTT